MFRRSPLFCREMRDANRRETDPKTMTRRVISHTNSFIDGQSGHIFAWIDLDFNSAHIDPGPSPAGNPGPYLKVHNKTFDTWHRLYPRIQPGDVWYMGEPLIVTPDEYANVAYGDDGQLVVDRDAFVGWHWKRNVLTSLYMPKWAARTFLLITDVRAERLRDISEADAIAEGFTPETCERFFDLAAGKALEPDDAYWVESEDREDITELYQCEACARKLQRKHKGSTLSFGVESDGPASCDDCGRALYISLTKYGIERELFLENNSPSDKPYWPASGVDARIAGMIAGGIGDLQQEHRGRLAQIGFATAWNVLNAKRGHPWLVNDWVWVYSYKTATPAEVEATRKD